MLSVSFHCHVREIWDEFRSLMNVLILVGLKKMIFSFIITVYTVYSTRINSVYRMLSMRFMGVLILSSGSVCLHTVPVSRMFVGTRLDRVGVFRSTVSFY